ncbi:kinase-like protein [Aspergillus aculeatinus CBS 121060]|uniref:Kinase-like protein n=1 Tax=Aspergillus aculeatinus CBS 121060 TaxID=1448322 RepID=A0ACD1HJ24_9EURO|nr:kinase-like protein [Aspergillus aculeatinus CBS 121060]RAH73521.1 kinase-like protein [Aspergillus aculeatinus CBS 121060]
MNGDPLLIQPEGTVSFIALGSAGAVFQDSDGQVIKTALKHDTQGCEEHVVEHVQHIESISELCIGREKLIYRTLPKNPHILECLEIGDNSFRFPYHRRGNLHRWIGNAIDAIKWIHSYGVIHADISPRNFLVADDLSIKLCDFAGSAIRGLRPLVEEEDRYRIAPLTPRTCKTDLFALGCLVYEISTGTRPYEEIEDTKEVEKLDDAQEFPDIDGLKYQSIIYKCWTCQYTDVNILRGDYSHCISPEDYEGTPVAL